MSYIIKTLLLCLGVLIAIAFIGCASSAEEELEKAEQMLDEALAFGGADIASNDYQKAQELFSEAMDLLQNERRREARSKAKKSILCAEDAINRAKKHKKALEDEEERREF